MKNKKIVWLSSLMAICFGLFVISACNKKFDEPDAAPASGLIANKTIKELKAMAGTSGSLVPITSDIVISGIVTANDRSGNLFKELYIQDASGAIALRLEAYSLFTSFPVGRQVFVVCKGLYLGNVNNMIELGVRVLENTNPVFSGIDSRLVDTYVKGDTYNNPVVPRAVSSLAELNTDLQGVLVKLSNYEVSSSSLNSNYSDTSVNKSTTNINIENCTGASSRTIIRTSGFANFAGIRVPQGNGDVTAIYTVFNTTKQLIIRDTNDVQFYGSRCGLGSTTLINISDVRALYTSSPVTAPASRRITGVVISDRAAANVQAQNLVLQQGNNLSGIVVRFSAAHNFNLGDSIDVNITGGTIDKFSGLLQVATLSLSNALFISSGKSITPRVTTNAALNTNVDAWESTLVRINTVTITGGTAGTWGSNGSTTITDATGSVTHFTRSGATFQGTAYPATATSITGIVARFNTTNQIGIRNLTDVVGGTGGGPGPGTGTVLLDENFESTTGNITLTNWFNGPEVGTRFFTSVSATGFSRCAQATAFGTPADPTVKSWLVTRGINFSTFASEILTFESRATFANGSTLKVLVSNNYSGAGNPWVAGVTWNDISSLCTLHPGTSTNGAGIAFTPSGNVNLSSYTGTVYIAFVYEGGAAAPAKTTNWQIDNVKIVGN